MKTWLKEGLIGGIAGSMIFPLCHNIARLSYDYWIYDPLENISILLFYFISCAIMGAIFSISRLKNIKAWLRGGIIGVIFWTTLFFVMLILDNFADFSIVGKLMTSFGNCLSALLFWAYTLIFPGEYQNYFEHHYLMIIIFSLVAYFIIGSIIGLIISKIEEKNKKEMKAWFKGGMIGGMVGLVFVISIFLIIYLDWRIPFGNMLRLIIMILGFSGFIIFRVICYYLGPKCLDSILIWCLLFIIIDLVFMGAIIGLIVSKFKEKNKKRIK